MWSCTYLGTRKQNALTKYIASCCWSEIQGNVDENVGGMNCSGKVNFKIKQWINKNLTFFKKPFVIETVSEMYSSAFLPLEDDCVDPSLRLP